ncbi:putative repeat protein (TIGR01451 family)/gliding motility-associated-like protein [Ulvibacter sp. MAR_2010_11]|uniref:DUF7507 domain-containing protein n=1 Tax=Ulvibacter sp. MAR_2010_11 TaxID=1250229 RepID=UPI000C2CD1F0|nr:Ig-like domain-containing protein [Ulvibacter sp. MAR_2010_11]PKA83674.1 putative repeat protein (TIGR01451 family)/gliding motility-associated-like protein [Ulvibacter sp. MAR_2010_11]
MQNITYSILHKRFFKYVSILTFIFSSMLVYGQDPLPTIVPNTNRGLPFLYALPDNGNDLFSVAPDPTSDPLPTPAIQSTDRTFNGEGSGFRASNRRVYAFANDHDLYEVNPANGNSTLKVDNMFTGVVQGVEFYLNNVTGAEVMFVIVDPSGDGTGGTKLYAYNPNNNWASYAGYPKTLSGAINKADGIAWNPVNGDFYVQNDDEVDFYFINVTNGNTTFAFSTEFEIDGEGIGFAADGKLYIEDEGDNLTGGDRRIYEVNLSNGDLTAVAKLGGSSDVEGIMGNVGVRDDGGDIPNSYGWAAHQLPVLQSDPITIYLGTVAPDSEDPFTTVNGGFGDDATGIDDEDGVKLNGDLLDNKQLNAGSAYTLTVKTNGNGVLSAWIDWNGDGDFDSNEKVANNIAPSGNNINLNINVPSSAAMGVTYARFRYSSQHNLAASYSEAPDGEVEDYKISIVNTPIARECGCAPFYNNSNFVNPVKIAGSNLQVGAVYRFSNVFPGNPHGNVLDALVKIEAFNNGASLLDIDVTGTGLNEAFQPRINSTNGNDQSVEFSVTFVTGGGNYGDEVVISFFGTPLDIDGDGNSTREYAEISLPDAYFLASNPKIDISRGATYVRGEARNTETAPGGDVSLDPRWTYSNYFENKSSLRYKIGKIDGNDDRYYSLDMDNANYNDPNSVLITYPVICGKVTDQGGDPLVGVEIDVTGSDGSSQTVTTGANGSYKAVAAIPEALVDVTYEIRENDLPGYESISDVDGANDNLITRVINLMSTCGNDFVDGVDTPDGWNFECGDDKVVDEYGYNANCNLTTVASIPNPANVYQYVVEIVYKGSNPGQSITFTDSSNNSQTLYRSVPVGTSSNIWVYRGLFTGNTSTITYTNNSSKCQLQSLVVYAFRNVPDASSSSGVFTSRSGVNDVQTITIDIPAFTGPRNLTIEAPISELTADGRYLLLKAESGGVSDQVFIYGPDASLPGGTCCLAIPTLTLNAVPGAATQVVITVDTRNNQNGQTVNGQSWVIASGVNVDGDCYEELELVLESKTNILCNGASTGSITVMATGGVPPYMYSLNGGTPQASPTFNNLPAGVYTIGVTDTLGNSDSISVTLTQPEPLSIQITKINATATGGCLNGQATANPSGGVGPYTYQWSASAGSQTTQTAINLAAGTHTVVVTDANGCTLQQGVVIDCVPNCDATINVDNVTHVLCTGDMTGSATVSASSVLNPGATFTFTWNTVPVQVDAGVTSSTVSGLGAGVYTVSVTIDGTLCQPVQQSVTITQPSNALNVTATSTDETGPTTGDGTATANPTGGTPPYTYVWSPGGQTTQTITGLSAGTYTVTVTDANGCTATASTIVNPGSCRDLAANASSTPVSCNGGNNGTATVGVTGGLGPFSYSWSPGGQTTQTITGLTAGAYTVTVTDQSTLCTASSTTTVNQPGALSSGIAVTNVACFGENTGSLDLTVTGGTPPYSFLWSPGGETTEDLFNLVAGTYSVLITDANGCTKTDSATVMQPSAELSLNIISQTDILCSAPSSVTVEAAGGTPPYLYALDGGAPQASGTFTNLSQGIHSIVVVDANGCDASVQVTILKNCTVAVDDINDTFVNIPVDGNVLTNDFDLEGDTQTVTTTTVTTVQGVIVNIDPVTGAYTYTPPVDYIGEDTFEYTICDDGNPQACDSAVVYIEVEPTDSSDNDPPVANADTNTTQVNVPVDGNVLPNDYDPDGDPIVVTANTNPANGSVVINPDGSYTYTPNPNYVGQDTFQYTICDNGTPPLCDTATVTIQILDTTDNITTAVDDSYFTQRNTPISANVLDNDTDPEGDNQTVDIAISPSNGPSNGTVVLNADGTFTYTPDPGYFGPDSFVYSIFDDGTPVATDSATVTILVSAFVNTTVAVDDINDTFVNIPVSGNVLTNDFDLEGDTQTVTTTTVTTVQGVIVNIDPVTGAYTYTPPLDYIGEDSFEYTICDDGSPQACDSAVVYIEVEPIDTSDNDPPVANADTNTTQVDVPVDGNVLPNDYDPDGDPIVVTANTNPANGSVVVNPDGSYTYTPNPGFVGQDIFQYTICDNGTPALCDTATVTIQVLDTTDNITTAVDDSYYTTVGIVINGNVLDNDTDPEGDNQTVDIAISPANGPSNGTVVLNADGTFTYTPNPGYFGPDSFVYSIFDDGTPVATDSATVTILVGIIGNKILAIDDINDTYMNLPVSGSVATNDENADGPAGTEVFTLVSGPSNGALVFNPDGTYTYTPGLDFTGEDTFEYQICDGGNPIACDTATVYIEVLPIGSPDNEPPVANADTNTTEVDTPVSGNVMVNDFDPDGDPITVTGNTNPVNGTVVVNPDGSYTYTPNPGFVGEDTFEYTICDDGAPIPPPLCDTATVTIQVIPNNGNITVANDDAYNGFIDMPISGNVLDNDNDPEGDTQMVDTTLTPVSGPSNGTLTINADGTFTYTPNAGFTGTDQFVYAIFDNGAPVATDQATVYLTVGDPGNTILAIDDINDTFVNLPVSGDVGTNDDNLDGPAGTEVFTLVSGPSNGALVFNPDGTYTYTPGLDYVGEDSFEYQICDGGNPIACDTATVTIEIVDDPVIGNDPPIANNDTNVTEVDTPVSGNVIVNDYDLDGDPITVTANTNPVNGTVVVNPDGTYTYTPNPGFVGEDTFEYTICDNGTPALCDTATVTIYIIVDNNNITVANDDSYYSEVNQPINGNVLDNDNDPEGDTQMVDTALTPVSGPSNGTLSINADGTFTYTPNAGFTGTDQFVYAIFDNGAPVATDQATVYILIEETPAPAIAIVKSGIFVDGNGDQCADPGESIDYTFTVTNTGNVPLGSVTVTDPLLGGIIPGPDSGDANNDGWLDITETWIYTASYAITQIDIDAGEVINQATAEGTDEDGTTVSDLSGTTTTTDDTTVITLCQNPVIAIVKTGLFVDGNGDQCADPGESIDYTFTVTNEGNVSLASIVVTDPLLGGPIAGPDSGDTDNDGELDVTETWIYTGSYIITQDDIDAGQVTNQATAEGTAPDTTVVSDLSDDTSVLEDDPTVTTLCQSPAIAIVKTGIFVDDNGDECADPGESINYTFTVTNEGNVSLASIVVTDPLLGGPIAGPDSGDTDNDGELDVTETWIYTATYAITQDDIDAGEVINQATAEGTAPDTTVVSDLSDDNSVLEDDPTVISLCQEPVIAIIKTGIFNDEDQDGCSNVDETISYTFTVENEGNVSLSNIVVDDPLLGGPIPGPDSGDTDNDNELDVTETWIYTATYTITQADIDAGNVTNQATAEGTAPDTTVVTDLSDDDNVFEDDPTVTELCQNASIALIKEGGLPPNPSGGGCPVPGDIIEYTFTVVNTGNITLNNVIVTDPLVAVVGGPITLPVGATDGVSFTASYVITQADVDAGEVINQATAEGTTPGGTTVSDLSDDDSILEDDPTVVDLCQSPFIGLVKVGTFNDEDGDKCADPKETITYTFTVYNLGNVTLTNITISDPLVNVQGGPITLAPLTSDGTSFTATYLITQADINNGFVENQAIATGFTLLGAQVSDLSDNNSEFEDDPTQTDLCQEPVIALIKVGIPGDENGNGCVDLGETIVYDFVVTNLGNVALTNVTVTDPLVSVVGGPVSLAAGASDTETFSAVYIVTQADVDAGQVTNQATASGTAPDNSVVTDLSDDNSNFEDDQTITVLCQDPSMSVTKSGVFNDDNGDQIPQPGETISYFFSVTNTGNVTLYNITLSDELPGIVLEGGPIAQLDPGEVDDSTFTATYAITEADIAAGEVINQAIGTGETIGGDEVSDTSDDPNDLTNVDPDGDGEPDDPTVTVIPNVLPANFEIFNGVTPDGDGLNDYFQIDGIEDYPINNVKIFNRWGVLVWETDGYGVNGNVFRGVSSGRSTVKESKELPTGTYFYILTFPGGNPGDNPGETNYSGYLYINR